MIRLLVVDDQELVRAGLRLIVAAEEDLEVVGEASDGRAGVDQAASLRPDVVLMDVRMPVLDGIAATRQIVGRKGDGERPCPVLALTTFEDDDVLWGVIEAGAAGFVLKDAPANDLVAAIRVTARGGSWLDPRVASRVLQSLRQASPPSPGNAPSVEHLSQRELEVLRLVAQGANNSEIAGALYVSERTVKGHVSAIFTKLGVRDRAGAIVRAYEAGVVAPGQR
ncbi:MAG: response regulator transcription factor [Actinomycetota bacterium]|nr:response regulator transcription factor [Actinomycetota bacterium]